MEQINTPRRKHREWTGIFLIIVGGLLLAEKLHAGLPEWIFTWPVLVIGIGILNGFQHNFRNPSFFIIIIVGAAFLINDQFQDLRITELLWPGVLILTGLMFILRKRGDGGKRRYWKERIKGELKQEWKQDWKQDWEKWNEKYSAGADFNVKSKPDGEYIDSTNVFGGTKKVVLSKNFRGGEITCFFGGAEIDFTQADIQSPVILDVTMVFGGIKLAIPSNWDVRNEVTPVFGGIEDKRTVAVTAYDPNKTLVLTGTAVFAGIELRNY